MKLIGEAKNYWYDVESLRLKRNKPIITYWEDMKETLRKKYVPSPIKRDICQNPIMVQFWIKETMGISGDRLVTGYVAQFSQETTRYNARLDRIMASIQTLPNDLEGSKIVNFVPFWSKREETTVLVCKPELETPYPTSGQILVIPTCFGKYRPECIQICLSLGFSSF
jgi:hypothetical protein